MLDGIDDAASGLSDFLRRREGTEAEPDGPVDYVAGQAHREEGRRGFGRAACAGRTGRTGYAGEVEGHDEGLAVEAGEGEAGGVWQAGRVLADDDDVFEFCCEATFRVCRGAIAFARCER